MVEVFRDFVVIQFELSVTCHRGGMPSLIILLCAAAIVRPTMSWLPRVPYIGTVPDLPAAC